MVFSSFLFFFYFGIYFLNCCFDMCKFLFFLDANVRIDLFISWHGVCVVAIVN
jgi:hypothetical protein